MSVILGALRILILLLARCGVPWPLSAWQATFSDVLKRVVTSLTKLEILNNRYKYDIQQCILNTRATPGILQLVSLIYNYKSSNQLLITHECVRVVNGGDHVPGGFGPDRMSPHVEGDRGLG